MERVWRYYTNNQVDTSYTGFAASGSDQVYLINGVQNTSYSGLIYNGGNWYYVQKGVRNTAYSGLSVYNGSWYYVKGGTADWSYTGLAPATEKKTAPLQAEACKGAKDELGSTSRIPNPPPQR